MRCSSSESGTLKPLVAGARYSAPTTSPSSRCLNPTTTRDARSAPVRHRPPLRVTDPLDAQSGFPAVSGDERSGPGRGVPEPGPDGVHRSRRGPLPVPRPEIVEAQLPCAIGPQIGDGDAEQPDAGANVDLGQ